MDYPDHAQLSPELQDAVTARGSLNVYRMVTHSPGLAPSFLALADAVLRENSLPADLRELAIVRVGRTYDAHYEYHHHETIGRLVGLSAAAITAAGGSSRDGLSDLEAKVLDWTDALLGRHQLDDTEVADVLEHFTVTQLADLVMTVGFYQLVSNFLKTSHVTTDGETVPY